MWIKSADMSCRYSGGVLPLWAYLHWQGVRGKSAASKQQVMRLLTTKRCAIGLMGAGWIRSETLYHRDDALQYIVYVMLILAVPIPVDRWHCSLWL